jgi:polar amino acid transport system substrate-binding protein
MGKKQLIFLIIVVIGIISVAGYIFFRPPREEIIEDPMLRKIKTLGQILVGTEATYPPMEDIDEEGNPVGIDIDIAKEIAFDLGVKPEFRNFIFSELFDALLRGEVDMLISAITITPERAEKMAFSDPYFNAGQAIVTTLDKVNEIKGTQDLTGKKLGVQIGTTSLIEAQKYTDLELVIPFENNDLAKDELLKGAIDAIIIDYPAAIGMVFGEETLRIVGEPFTQEFYGIAVRKEEKVLLEEINKTIRRLKRENIIEEMEKKWLAE